MTISTRFCNFLIASRSCLDRLSRITAGCEDMRSCCTAVVNVSRAGSLHWQGGVHDPLHLKGWLLASVAAFPSLLKNSLRRKRLAKSSMPACISDQLMRCSVGTKVYPRESSSIRLCSKANQNHLLRGFVSFSACWDTWKQIARGRHQLCYFS